MSTQDPHRDRPPSPADPQLMRPIPPAPPVAPPAAKPIAAWMPPPAPAPSPAPPAKTVVDSTTAATHTAPTFTPHAPASRKPAANKPVTKRPAAKKPAPIGTPVVQDDQAPAVRLPLKERIFRHSPPWLVSTIVHMVLLIALAFITIPSVQKRVMEITGTYSEFVGQQLESFNLSGMQDIEQMESDMAIGEVPVEDPLAAPPIADIDPSGLALASNTDLRVPTIGTLLHGREAGNKESNLLAYGGTQGSEDAVRAALDWLKRYQQRDGSWRLNGPYSDPGNGDNRTAATAMAMLAFLGAGHTHQSDGPYKSNVLKGMTALLKMEDDDGRFASAGAPYNHQLYSHAQATIAICELYAMTKDEKLREPAQRAINYCANIQAPEGGWRYDPKVDSDTSVTGWFAMALQSGLMAGLNVPSFTLDGIGRYLDSAQVDDGSRYAYQPGQGPRISMTAEALLCRQYLGWQRDDERLQRGVADILANPVSWDQSNVYYWYYATQVLHHFGGKEWFQWNTTMREELIKQQVKSDRERGSWSPGGDAYDAQGGRLYMTCLCTYMLEVYYRHLPIYRK